MKDAQRKRIVDRHRDSLMRYGHSPHALYWSGREIQEIRFAMLADIGIEAGNHVLDVGCGFGDFLGWFERQHGCIEYTGLDLSPDLLEEAARLNPVARFYSGDIFDLPADARGFDWVILSGALNENLNDDGAYARKVIARMYALCRRGVAFNLLDARYVNCHDLQAHDPTTILNYCTLLCPDCKLRDDYLANDFTIYMYKGRSK